MPDTTAVTPPPGMSEWLKILITAIAGMFAGLSGGLLLEPIKHHIQLRIKTRRIKADVHRELGFLFFTFTLQASNDKDAERVKTYFDLSNNSEFEYYYSHEREAFNRLKDRRDIRAFYTLFQRVRETVLEEKIHPIDAAKMITKDLKSRFEVSGLNEKLIQKYIDEYIKILDKQGKKRLKKNGGPIL
jgi:hypothetical protein